MTSVRLLMTVIIWRNKLKILNITKKMVNYEKKMKETDTSYKKKLYLCVAIAC